MVVFRVRVRCCRDWKSFVVRQDGARQTSDRRSRRLDGILQLQKRSVQRLGRHLRAGQHRSATAVRDHLQQIPRR